MSYMFQGMTPRRHQLHTIEFYLNNKRCYNFSDLGSGKTASTLWALDMLINKGLIKSALVICPISIMQAVWVNEIRKIVPHLSYSIVHGNRDMREKALSKPAHIYITNHDALRTYLPDLVAKLFSVVVIDELDAYKNVKSKRSKHMQLLAARVKAVWGLTGTPMANSPMEAFGIAKVVNPSILPTQYKTKWQRMTMNNVYQYIWEPNENAEQLCHKVLQPAIRYKLEDCVDIPDIIHETREFTMVDDQLRLYKKILKDQIAEYNDGLIVASTAAVKFTKLLQITAGVVRGDDGLPLVVNIKERLDEVNHICSQTNKVIIFCQFVEVAKYLHSNLVNSLLIYGDVSLKERTTRLKKFEKEDRCKVLIAQPRVASHGLNLQFANTIIFWGPILGNNYYRQCTGRIRRSGQKYKQLVINFAGSKVERELYKQLEKREVSSQMLLEMYTKTK